MIKLVITIVVALWSQTIFALPDLPHYAGESHLGVSSCASSTCHGSIQPREATKVLQNEYVVWSRMDSHSKAYKTLLSEESQWIAKNLGLPNAHEASICLDCHADNVGADLQGARFQISDGVGCEACHGGGEKYIKSHTDPNASHANNIANGLYPTDQVESRAALCLSCHVGHEDKIASHKIMGAGHPRLGFELDTFTILQPAHYRIDEDYKKAKWNSNSATVWALGQVEAAKQTLRLIEHHLKNDGLFPELSLFDCHSCHHPMSDLKWQPSERANLPPGSVRLNDAGLVMLIPLDESSTGTPIGIENSINALQLAAHKDQDIEPAIERLKSQIDRLERRIQGSEPSHERLLDAVFSMASNGEFRDYVAAEQAVMAVALLIDSVESRQISSAWLDRVYESVADEDTFDPYSFAEEFSSAKF